MKIYLIFIVFVASQLSALADVTISMKHESNGKLVDTELSFSGEKVRMDSTQGGVILIPSQDQMLMLMHAQKQYMSRSLEQTAAMNQTAAKAAEEVTFQTTGQQEEINGFDCQQIIGTQADGDVIEFWVSKESVHTDKFLSSMKAFDKIQGKNQGNNQMEAWKQFFKSNPELSTFPIRTVNKNAAGEVESITTVKSISEDSIPDKRFQVPAGYTALAVGGIPGIPAPGEVTTSKPAMPIQPDADVLQELQALQQEIQQRGGRPTPAQIQRLQELAAQYKVPQ